MEGDLGQTPAGRGGRPEVPTTPRPGSAPAPSPRTPPTRSPPARPDSGAAAGGSPAKALPRRSANVVARQEQMRLDGGAAGGGGGGSVAFDDVPGDAGLTGTHMPTGGGGASMSRTTTGSMCDARGADVYRTSLDREFVQKEVRWAMARRKNIIVLYEGERQGKLNFNLARARYCGAGAPYFHGAAHGGEFAPLFDIDAEMYMRDAYYQQGFIQKILDKAEQGGPPNTAPEQGRLNEPGTWKFFLSHHTTSGGDQMAVVWHLLEAAGQTCWLDQQMKCKHTNAMREGVDCSDNFIFMLTHDEAASVTAEEEARVGLATRAVNKAS